MSSGLLLIDLQKAFTVGSWARYFGLEEVVPINKACQNVADLLSTVTSICGGHNYVRFLVKSVYPFC